MTRRHKRHSPHKWLDEPRRIDWRREWDWYAIALWAACIGFVIVLWMSLAWYLTEKTL